MREIDGIEKAIEILKPHWQDIQNNFDRENAIYISMQNQPHDILGRVLKCHLIVESYMTKFLSAYFAIQDIDTLKLTFFQKAQLLPSSGSTASWLKNAIIELNQIRNKFAHRIDSSIHLDDVRKMRDVLSIAHQDVLPESPMPIIEKFTTFACTFMIVAPKQLQEVFMKAFAEVVIAPSHPDEQS